MRFSSEKDNLLVAINSVSKAVSSKTIMPILECFLIEAKEGMVKFTATDMELGIEYIINANVEEEGKVIVDSKMFSEIIRKLPDSDITISLNPQGLLLIESEGSLFKIVTVNNNKDFPELPKIVAEQSLEIKQSILKEMIRKTIFSVGFDENRPVFTGTLIELKDGILNVVALDGFRLAWQKRLFTTTASEFKAIIPGRTLNEISKILQDNDDIVKIGISKNQGLFEMSNCKAVTRILEGQFLDYKNVIPVEKELRVKVNKNVFISSLERAALMSREEKQYPIKVSVTANNMIIACAVQTGDVREELTVETFGKDIEIGFNPKYVIEAVRAVEDEEIYVDFGTAVSPAVVRPIDGDDFVYMVLPVRI